MSDHDSFEDRLRAVADQINQSVQRMSEVDLDEFAARYGIDAERTRSFADAAGRWLNDLVADDPLFGRRGDPDSPHTPSAQTRGDAPSPAPPSPSSDAAWQPAGRPGPHPLDLPIDRQGLALSALDSGRWSVRPGSNQLTGTEEGPPPPSAGDLVSELRARDWITADGSLTITGRHALGRWCRTATEPTVPESGADAGV